MSWLDGFVDDATEMSTSTSSNSNNRTKKNRQVRGHRIASIHKAITDGEYSQLHNLLSIRSSSWIHSLQPPDPAPETRSASISSASISSVSTAAATYEYVYDTQLLWSTHNTAENTACHIAASHFVPTEWWEWVLQIASSSPTTSLEYQFGAQSRSQKKTNPFLDTINDSGQSVVDVFFRTYTNPMPWSKMQVRVRSNKLMKSISRVIAYTELQEKIRNQYYDYLQTCQNRYHTTLGTNSDNNNTCSTSISIMSILNVDSTGSTPQGSTTTATVIVPPHYDPLEDPIRNTSLYKVDNNNAAIHVTSFLINLHYLCHAIMRQQYSPPIVSNDNVDTIDIHQNSSINTVCTSVFYTPINIIDVLCYTGNCPSRVMKLLVTLFPMWVSDTNMNIGLVNHAPLVPMSLIQLHVDVGNEMNPIQSRTTCKRAKNSENSTITSTILPLHNWCSSACDRYNDQVCTMLPYLLSLEGKNNSNPITDENEKDNNYIIAKQRAMTIDPRTGKVPLLTAVQNGKTINQIQLLFDAAPEVLENTIYSKLPIFAWAANASLPSSAYTTDELPIVTKFANLHFSSLRTQENTKNNYNYLQQSHEQYERIVCRAKYNYANDNKLSIWRLATPSMQNDEIVNAAKQIDCEQLTTIYVLLKLCPIALQRAIEQCSA